MIYPDTFEEKLGFEKIRAKLKNYALSDLGSLRVDEMQFQTNRAAIATQLAQVREFFRIHEEEENFPLDYTMDMRAPLERIRVEGAYMELDELFNLSRSLKTIKGIVHFLNKKFKEDGSYPQLHALSQEVHLYPYVYERIGEIMNNHGEMKDSASPELQNIRRKLRDKEASLSSTAHQILNQAKKEQIIDKETSLTIRDGKMLIPVPSAYKRKIQGYVHDESASGKTSFIEPSRLFNMNNEIRELQFEEKREIMKILREFANAIRPYLPELLANYEFLAEIEFIRAKALLSRDLEAAEPVLTDDPVVDLRYARHPLLYLHYKQENREVVPLSLQLDAENRLLVISGPNAGGKSVCLQTAGLLQYMLQCGLPVPATDQSRMSIFRDIFIDMGDDQSIDNDLSTYSSHLNNMRHFIQNARERTLILIDELGTGTEPVMGGAIAEAVLDQLNGKQTFGVVTTHYTNLKHFATATDGLFNGAMLFDNDHMEPLFQLETGKPGSSFAFEIAEKIGLPAEVLEKARKTAGEDLIEFDRNLREIETEKRKLSDVNKRLKRKEQELDKEMEKYEAETKKTLEKRKNILALSREEAKDILASANKKIENTIAEIRRAQAEKERTREIRRKFEEQRTDAIKKQEADQKKIDQKIQKIKEKQAEKARRKSETNQEKPQKQEQQQEDDEIRVGDAVKLKAQDTTGEVLDIDDGQAVLAIGNMQMTVNLNRLQKTSKKQLQKPEAGGQVQVSEAPSTSKSKTDFLFGLDIRGKRVNEAIDEVAHYLDEAVVAEAPQVRILHGTGTGALRQRIREYLSTHDLVRTFYDERVDQGGAGITIAELDV